MKKILFITTLFFAINSQAHNSLVQPDRANIELYNLSENNLGANGYDVVAYFTLNAAIKGSSNVQTVYQGIRYNFIDEANRNEFLNNPARYEPAYGGWEAFAMANQTLSVGDYTKFSIINERLFIFVSNGSRARFLNDFENFSNRADQTWLTILKESTLLYQHQKLFSLALIKATFSFYLPV